MGELAVRSKEGCLKHRQVVKVKDLIAEGDVKEGEIIYQVTNKTMHRLGKEDKLQPGQKYGVVPENDLG